MKKLVLLFLILMNIFGVSGIDKHTMSQTTGDSLFFDNTNKNIVLHYDINPNQVTDKYNVNNFLWLNGSNCVINWNGTSLGANFLIGDELSFPFNIRTQTKLNNNIIDYLRDNKEIEYFEINSNNQQSTQSKKIKSEKILKNNLWMRVELIYKFYDDNNQNFQNFTNLVYIDDLGISEKEIKGVELPLSKNQYDFVNVSATISESKCPITAALPGQATSLNNFISFQGEYLIETEQSGTRIRDKSDLHKDNDKVIINNDSNKIEFTDSSGNYEEAFIDEINKDMKVTINGETFTKSLDIKEVALILHEVKKVDGINDAKLTLDNITEATNSLDLEKEVLIDEDIGETKVTLEVSGETDNNTILWMYLPKDTNLSLYDFGGADNLIVKDEDPIVGWKNPKIIDYTINGETIDSSILYFEQVPIVYNSNNLIFNYRASVCADREIYLFSTKRDGSDTFIDSEEDYLSSSDTLYNLCVSHFDKSITFDRDNFVVNNNLIQSLMSDNFNLFKNYNSNLNYNYYISKDPPSYEFSCFGSFNALEEFGDCDFSQEKRIWVYLGDLDFNVKPQIKISDLKFSSSTKLEVNLSIVDTQDFSVNATINEKIYNLDESNFTNGYLNNLLDYTCDNCRVLVTANLSANENNVLDSFRNSKDSKEVVMPKKSLRCTNSCTNNFDDRIYSGCSLKLPQYCSNIPTECEGTLKGSWEKLEGVNYEVKCEVPFNIKRSTLFTNEKVKIDTSGSSCNNIINKRVPIKIDGKFVNMVLMGCLE